LPEGFAFGDRVFVAENIVAELADGDPVLRVGFLVLSVEGGLGSETVEG
jgi:hypothetical protein